MYKQLKVFENISSENRISSIDVCRAVAIISVVIHHFSDFLTYGNLGVDLFFVISGFLIGGVLTKYYNDGVRINFFKFILQRGFKVWPSYYAFLILGTLIAYIFYHSSAPEQIIPFWDFKRYLFFYQNYTGAPFHWSFDHVWSLCVEEHFYILLPILFIIVQRYFKSRSFLFLFVSLAIISGVVFKFLSYYYTNGKDTHSATHCRIDALAWGVLLNFIVIYKKDEFLKMRRPYLLFFTGLILFIVTVYYESITSSVIFHKIIFQSLTPFCFFLMIAGIYNYDFSKLKPLRIAAYYSYNWYLWHPLFVIVIMNYAGKGSIGLIIYLLVSFSFAVIFTVWVEEPFLAKRNATINKLFKKQDIQILKQN